MTPLLNIVAGPLGAGKTSAVVDYLRRHRPEGENVWALVNDFGALGLDADTVGEAGPTAVRRVPGGCVCCTAATGLYEGLLAALEAGADRVLLEPSGMVGVDRLLEVLDSLGLLQRVELRAILVLIDPARVNRRLVEAMPYFSAMVGAADVLVANRWSLASREQQAHFHDWSGHKRTHTTDHGVLPGEFWNLPHTSTPAHGHSHQTEEAEAFSAVWPAGTRFDLEALSAAIQGHRPELLRFKGIFEGTRVEFASGRLETKPTQDAGPPRAEWITNEQDPDGRGLEQELNRARLS